MKISMDGMPKLRADAVTKINQHFNALSLQTAHRDQAHARKRDLAALVVADEVLPDNHPFAQEAALRGMSVAELAALILSKSVSTALDGIELERQRYLLMIDAAGSTQIVEGILNGLRLGQSGVISQ